MGKVVFEELLFWGVTLSCALILKLYFDKKDNSISLLKEELFKIVANFKRDIDKKELSADCQKEIKRNLLKLVTKIDSLRVKELDIFKKELEKKLSNYQMKHLRNCKKELNLHINSLKKEIIACLKSYQKNI